ncbi:MAG: T9SS type A sorting domain-containing protein, partial [Bacteroidota bacterium]
MKKLFILILISLFVLNVAGDNYLTRGHQPGELYVASIWFQYVDTTTEAIFFTDDYGKSLVMRYYHAQNSGNMVIGKIVTDLESGIIYNNPLTTLWRSVDMAYSWEQCQAPAPYGIFTAGNMPGQVYEVFTNEPAWRVELHRSNDYGNSFICVNDSISGRPEVCTDSNGIYLYYFDQSNSELTIKYSNDNGVTFPNLIVLDSTYAGKYSGYDFPLISRGTKAGEIFLVSLFDGYVFKVFHSINYGVSFNLRYTSTPWNITDEFYSFSAGNESGSFFYSKMIPLYNQGPNTLLCIYHSSDTAHTFTEYCHILDTGFPVSVHNDAFVEDKLNEIFIYPNPVGSTATIKIDAPHPGNHTFEIFSISGNAVIREEKYLAVGEKELKLHTDDLLPGVYICSIKSNGKVIGVQKF